MCGITGFLEKDLRPGRGEPEAIAGRMAETLRHRGPDDHGAWADRAAGIALGHRRLPIIDLSSAGRQPMHSAGGRYVIIYNGEVYDYQALKKELTPRGHIFKSASDTEVVLASIEEWGLEAAVKKFIGMFAFTLWDRRERRLHLVRDRLGLKPLYYGWLNGAFLFGSELKALRVHPLWAGEINRDVLALYLRSNYIPAPYSIYTGIYTLVQGTILTVEAGNGAPASFSPYAAEVPTTEVRPQVYWSARRAFENGASNTFAGSDEEAARALDTLLKHAVSCRMIADVPLGAFLSGGVDSSTVVSLMQAAAPGPVRTFTIGFHEQNYNEAVHAKAVADHLGTEHTELYVTAQEAMDVIPKLPTLYDEPFADASQIPTFLVSEMTRSHVTVSLSGDGGDEVFGGYNRYTLAPRIWNNVGRLPRPLKHLARMSLTGLPLGLWPGLFKAAGRYLPSVLRERGPGDVVYKMAEIIEARSPAEVYRQLTSHFKDPTSIVSGSIEPPTIFTDPARQIETSDFIRWMMYTDMVSYHPDDILVKVDRASMGVGLEARVPLIDHRVVEFAATLPERMLIRKGQGKWILRRVLYKYVPPKLIERPKMGFGAPIGLWLKGPLRPWPAP